jgi:hypothetical protein
LSVCVEAAVKTFLMSGNSNLSTSSKSKKWSGPNPLMGMTQLSLTNLAWRKAAFAKV